MTYRCSDCLEAYIPESADLASRIEVVLNTDKDMISDICRDIDSCMGIDKGIDSCMDSCIYICNYNCSCMDIYNCICISDMDIDSDTDIYMDSRNSDSCIHMDIRQDMDMFFLLSDMDFGCKMIPHKGRMT